MIDSSKILRWFIYVISAILLVAVVFFLTLWVLSKFAGPSPPGPSEFPNSPVSNNFPPPPTFIKVSNIYFDGPYPLEQNSNIDSAGIFLILCQKDKNYGIIYIGETEGGINLSGDACWSDSCQGSLYISRFWMSTEKYKTKDRQNWRTFLESENNPSCVLNL